MAIFGLENLSQFRQLDFSKIFNLFLHSCMLTLCLISSTIFLEQCFETIQKSQQIQTLQFWSLDNLLFLIWRSINYLKIKILIPTFVFCYFYYCIKQRIFYKLIKDQYIKKYDDKYTKIHKLNVKSQDLFKKTDFQSSSSSQAEIDQRQKPRDLYNHSFESSLNMSIQMVKSMSRSMIGSFKSIGTNPLTKSVLQKGNTMHRNSKLVQTISKKTVQSGNGKDLSTLFDKGKNLSESFMSASSSGLQGDEFKIRIKNRKYCESSDQKDGNKLRKQFQEANKKFVQSVKNQKIEKTYHQQLLHLKKGLQRQMTVVLKEHKQNTQLLKQCLVRFWGLKIQGFQSKKSFKTGYELSSIFQPTQNKKFAVDSLKSRQKDIVVPEQSLLKKVLSPSEFIKRLINLKVSLRDKGQQPFAQKQLIRILQMRVCLNAILNISQIQGEMFGCSEKNAVKSLQKIVQLLSGNKIDIFSFPRNENQHNEMEVLEQYEVQKIKDMVELRRMILLMIVNKINFISADKNFKVKMKEAVTYDSGYLSTALSYFKNKKFAEIICQKGCDNLISHYNLKICDNLNCAQSSKTSLIYCRAGIDNSFSVILFLAKKISEHLNENLHFKDRPNNEDIKKEQNLKRFIESLYPKLAI